MSTLLNTVSTQITDLDLPLILTWHRFSHPSRFWVGFNHLFPHIFSVLHHNSIETSWFSLVIHESPLTEEKTMPSSIDTRISMLTPPVSRRAHFALPKKTYTQIKAFEVFAFR